MLEMTWLISDGEQAENSGLPASRSAFLPQPALPGPEMPVPAAITVREAALGQTLIRSEKKFV